MATTPGTGSEPVVAEDRNALDSLAALINSDVLLPLIICVALLSLLVVFIDIRVRSKSDPRFYLSIPSGIYYLILVLGNTVAAFLLLIPFTDTIVAGSNLFAYAVIGSVAGVFSFEGILSNTNITVFNRGVLTIADWIGRARDEAVAFTIARDAQEKSREMIRNAQRLAELPDATLNTHVTDALGGAAAAELEKEATSANANPKLYKGLKLAGARPDYVQSILKG